VDKFKPDGTPDGNWYVGAPVDSIAFDDLTELVAVDGGLYDQNGNAGGPSVSGYPYGSTDVVGACNGFVCLAQNKANPDLSCVPITGSTISQPTVTSINVGSNPQALAMGVTGATTYAYTITVGGGTTTLWSVDVSDGMTNPLSQPVAGITPNAPNGTGIVVFDALGVGLIVSYGDMIAIPFNETTLESGSPITLPGIPVSVTADTANGVALIGNANPTAVGGSITIVDPVKGTATVIANVSSPSLPVSLIANPTGNGFYTCPQDDSACAALSIQ
jgi:hypothetical protein